MNKYNYDDIVIGTKEYFSVKITDDMMQNFLKITGDKNPMHIDDNFAHQKGFDQKVVYGMLTASFYSTLVGVYLPGENCLFQEAEIKFSKPCFVGDELMIEGEVSQKNDLFKRLTIKAKIYNQNKQVISKAKLIAGVLDE